MRAGRIECRPWDITDRDRPTMYDKRCKLRVQTVCRLFRSSDGGTFGADEPFGADACGIARGGTGGGAEVCYPGNFFL